MDIANLKVGILGGGQLGKMLNYTGNQWNLALWNLDKDPTFPASINAYKFQEGDFKNYDDVMKFGRQMDILTIEIEHVNIQALFDLKKEGIKIHPDPDALQIIKDKYIQNAFYVSHELPTPNYRKFESEIEIVEAIKSSKLEIPFVQKTRGEGYDGRGVKIVNNTNDLKDLLPGPCITEDKTEIYKEVAVVVARNEVGEVKCFDPVEMVFNEQNMLDYLFAPAEISKEIHEKLYEYSHKTIEAFGICGLLAIEFFLDTNGKVFINEVAPRPHNSGHHTLENAVTSQFEQHLRGILNLPLGSTGLLQPAAMLNILGEPGYEGPPYYKGMEKVMAIPNVHVHIYGKPVTRPYRKMGHITVCGTNRNEIDEKVKKVQNTLKVISK
ncbi:5-(carboxyamino)imidazole ribonucleotide synthase [Membranihabitans maritimus]|uniref:5-(carboxyamino)imidazole ribonucleotide synthase n=1 Tax=Membranihabitans maritimus TaxID=2904244 RepID=UPI001F016DB9|nr:5-(carboxyamino)imidazole ribonucleotide synthase [Membranihabitans maritimus]